MISLLFPFQCSFLVDSLLFLFCFPRSSPLYHRGRVLFSSSCGKIFPCALCISRCALCNLGKTTNVCGPNDPTTTDAQPTQQKRNDQDKTRVKQMSGGRSQINALALLVFDSHIDLWWWCKPAFYTVVVCNKDWAHRFHA